MAVRQNTMRKSTFLPESTVFFGEAPKARRGGMIARVKRGGGEKGERKKGDYSPTTVAPASGSAAHTRSMWMISFRITAVIATFFGLCKSTIRCL